MREHTIYRFEHESFMFKELPRYPASMRKEHLAGLAAHIKFVGIVAEFEDRFANNNLSAVCQLLGGDITKLIVKWLVEHIQGTDKRVQGYFDDAVARLVGPLKAAGVDPQGLSKGLLNHLKFDESSSRIETLPCSRGSCRWHALGARPRRTLFQGWPLVTATSISNSSWRFWPLVPPWLASTLT